MLLRVIFCSTPSPNIRRLVRYFFLCSASLFFPTQSLLPHSIGVCMTSETDLSPLLLFSTSEPSLSGWLRSLLATKIKYDVCLLPYLLLTTLFKTSIVDNVVCIGMNYPLAQLKAFWNFISVLFNRLESISPMSSEFA
jgi:hypothetical protein